MARKDKRPRFLSSALLNLAMIVLGMAVLVLLYGLIAKNLVPPTDPLRESRASGLVGEIIQVEVRNGCGVGGVAATVTHYLRRRGFDVVEVGDHSSFDQELSSVVDRVGDIESARKVAAALGISAERVLQDVRQDYLLDASVIIGSDYAALKPFRND
jgi:hypothetical protein